MGRLEKEDEFENEDALEINTMLFLRSEQWEHKFSYALSNQLFINSMKIRKKKDQYITS